MISLTLDEINTLNVEQFIFHIVQHEDDEPILLDETPIGGHERFFLDRVRDTLKGNHYTFIPGSATFQLIKGISENHNLFVPNSKQLAINFHAQRNGRIKPGAVIIMKLSTGARELYSLIKYDSEHVVAYNLVDASHAVLQEIVNSFTESKKALQKSALIELNKQGGDLVIIDQTVSYDITDFFRGFLNVRRILSENELTNCVHEAVIDTAVKHREELPKEITERVRDISYKVIKETDTFNEEEYFTKVFGPYATQKIYKTYESFLRKNGVEGDSFKFVKEAIKPPKDKKYRTREGVRIAYGQGAEKTVSIAYGGEGQTTIITIQTQQLTEE